MSAGGTSRYIPFVVRPPVDIIALRAPIREPRSPDLQRPDSFIEWGGPSDFADNSFREDAGSPIPREQDKHGKTALDGTWTEEGRTWEDYELSNPEDAQQKVILRRPNVIALRKDTINPDTKKFDQLTISLNYDGGGQSPHYHNAHGQGFEPAVFNMLTDIKEVHWGGPILLVLIGHYPEASMSGLSGDASSKALMGVHQQEELTNAIDLESTEQFPTEDDVKQAHYKGMVNSQAKIAIPEEDPPENDDDQGPAGDGWIGTPPEPVNVGRSDYGLKNSIPGGDPIPVITGLQADHWSGPGVAQGKGGRRVFFNGYGFVLVDYIQVADGSWVARFKFSAVITPDPTALSPGMHIGGLGGSGAIFDDYGHVGSITPPGGPGPGDDEPQPEFKGSLHQWRLENISTVVDDLHTPIDDYWTYRLWTKTPKAENKHKPAPSQVVGVIVNITKPLVTERLLNPGAKSYTLGFRYGGVDPNAKFKQNGKRSCQLRYSLWPRSRFDDLKDFLDAAGKRVDEKNKDPNFKYDNIDDFMNEFSPPFDSLESHKATVPDVINPYDNQFDLAVNLATGVEITLQT